jgi:hypothetical protein
LQGSKTSRLNSRSASRWKASTSRREKFRDEADQHNVGNIEERPYCASNGQH